jgi:hypothetical protein
MRSVGLPGLAHKRPHPRGQHRPRPVPHRVRTTRHPRRRVHREHDPAAAGLPPPRRAAGHHRRGDVRGRQPSASPARHRWRSDLTSSRPRTGWPGRCRVGHRSGDVASAVVTFTNRFSCKNVETVATKRPTSPAVGRNARETPAKSGKNWTRWRWQYRKQSPANRGNLSEWRTRLKIVVSPVRVQVSPSQAPKSRMAHEFSSCGWNGPRTGVACTRNGRGVPASSRESAPGAKRLQYRDSWSRAKPTALSSGNGRSAFSGLFGAHSSPDQGRRGRGARPG